MTERDQDERKLRAAPYAALASPQNLHVLSELARRDSERDNEVTVAKSFRELREQSC